jgi:hypothetical protein
MRAPWLRPSLVVLVTGSVSLGLGLRPLALGLDQSASSAPTPAVAKVGGPATAGLKPPVMLSNQDDRQRMMDLLKITSFPPSPAPYLAATYDEATANPYPNLPDPLTMNDGTKVTTAAQWTRRRSSISAASLSGVRRPKKRFWMHRRASAIRGKR